LTARDVIDFSNAMIVTETQNGIKAASTRKSVLLSNLAAREGSALSGNAGSTRNLSSQNV
jgi:hypothetical protein